MNLDDDFKRGNSDEIYSNSIRAGKRTYFFDVRSTKRGELFLTITESKKVFTDEGQFHFEKHKIFLYKEDFEKFSEGLNNVLEFINQKDGTQLDESSSEYNTTSSFDEESETNNI